MQFIKDKIKKKENRFKEHKPSWDNIEEKKTELNLDACINAYQNLKDYLFIIYIHAPVWVYSTLCL